MLLPFRNNGGEPRSSIDFCYCLVFLILVETNVMNTLYPTLPRETKADVLLNFLEFDSNSGRIVYRKNN